jgi:PAS domain S-box-containing protein
MNRTGKLLYTTASTTKVLGYDPKDLLGRNVFDLMHPDDVQRAAHILQQALATPGTALPAEIRVRHQNGEWAWIEGSAANLLHEPDIRAVVLNYRNISYRKAAEQERQLQAERLARSNAELAAFAYAVTHDLQEPLRSIAIFTELLVKRAEPDEDSQELASYVVDGVRRMSTLLDDLLAFASLNSTERRRVSLSHAVDQAMQNLHKAIREVEAEITVDPLPCIEGNPSHLMQLFQNLIGNALKYRGEDPVRIRISAESIGDEYVVKVADNGIGVPRAYRERIFGLFKRLHGHQIPGTGIGLAICKKIVEGLGGRIWVEPNGEKGSAFCFTVTPV